MREVGQLQRRSWQRAMLLLLLLATSIAAIEASRIPVRQTHFGSDKRQRDKGSSARLKRARMRHLEGCCFASGVPVTSREKPDNMAFLIGAQKSGKRRICLACCMHAWHGMAPFNVQFISSSHQVRMLQAPPSSFMSWHSAMSTSVGHKPLWPAQR